MKCLKIIISGDSKKPAHNKVIKSTKAPRTGDSLNVALYVALLAVGMLSIIMLFVVKRRSSLRK